jgi:hypothetical protein
MKNKMSNATVFMGLTMPPRTEFNIEWYQLVIDGKLLDSAGYPVGKSSDEFHILDRIGGRLYENRIEIGNYYILNGKKRDSFRLRTEEIFNLEDGILEKAKLRIDSSTNILMAQKIEEERRKSKLAGNSLLDLIDRRENAQK